MDCLYTQGKGVCDLNCITEFEGLTPHRPLPATACTKELPISRLYYRRPTLSPRGIHVEDLPSLRSNLSR